MSATDPRPFPWAAIRAAAAAAAAMFLLANLPAQEQDPPTTLEAGASCIDECHQTQTAGPFVHQPLTESKCGDCHTQAEATKHEFELVDEINDACLGCHEIEEEEVVHEPFDGADCTDCHNPHRSEVKWLLNAPDQQTLCWACHEPMKETFGKEFSHGPAAFGECSLCHNAHSAPEEKLLRQEAYELCAMCHTDLVDEVDAADYPHGPAESDCVLCHDAHASDQRFLLKQPRRELCFSCHDELQKHVGDAAVTHGALDDDKECCSCHLPHAAKFPKLLTGSVKDNCMSCHTEPIERQDGKPIAGLGAELEQRKFLHGPIREGDCSGCHKPHAAAVQDLLLQQYPPKFYAPYVEQDYELCFGCHDRKVFEVEKTTSLTNFRDGDVNLHYLHVSREEKGRTCRACHEVHASNLPKHLAETVPFGNWKMPIGFTQTPTGGACAPGCHKRFPYDYGKSMLPAK